MISKTGVAALNRLASAGALARITLKTCDADEIMLQTSGTVMSRGVLYNIICDKLTPSVCLLTLKQSN